MRRDRFGFRECIHQEERRSRPTRFRSRGSRPACGNRYGTEVPGRLTGYSRPNMLVAESQNENVRLLRSNFYSRFLRHDGTARHHQLHSHSTRPFHSKAGCHLPQSASSAGSPRSWCKQERGIHGPAAVGGVTDTQGSRDPQTLPSLPPVTRPARGEGGAEPTGGDRRGWVGLCDQSERFRRTDGQETKETRSQFRGKCCTIGTHSKPMKPAPAFLSLCPMISKQ